MDFQGEMAQRVHREMQDFLGRMGWLDLSELLEVMVYQDCPDFREFRVTREGEVQLDLLDLLVWWENLASLDCLAEMDCQALQPGLDLLASWEFLDCRDDLDFWA
jgi:hypothetical protein